MKGPLKVALGLGWLLIAVGPGDNRSLAAPPDLLVAGVAVYHDAVDGKIYPAPSTELILVGGHFDGEQPNVATPELDRDLTAGTSNGYRRQDEGIFHLAKDNPAFQRISIFYHLRNAEGPPGTPLLLHLL